MFQNIKLHHIRPYLSAHASFGTGINVLFGPNGAGKTTVLESMYVLATTRSYRATRLFDLITHEYEKGEIECETTDSETLKVEILPQKHIFLKNNTRMTRTSQFLHSVKTVILAPEHQELISGSAEQRRTLLDHMLCQKNPLLLDLFKTYRKTLKQKQALLKQPLSFSDFQDEVQPWNEKLVESGEQIRQHRKELVKVLLPTIQEEYRYISQDHESIVWTYKAREESMAQALSDVGFREYQIKRALVGPHRDDIDITIRNQRASQVASQGERASLLLALKFSEMTYLADPVFPTLLLDDVGMTLDRRRRQCLFERLEKLKPQTIITTPDPSILENLKDLGAVVLMRENSGLMNQFFWK